MSMRRSRARMDFDVVPVWKQVMPALKAELVDFWTRHRAISDPARAAQRAEQAVCVGRNSDGEICAVGTAEVRIVPQLQQPMYYFRLFFAVNVRGQNQMPPFFNRCRQVLQDYNAALPASESLGVLVELESRFLSSAYKRAHVAEMDSTFIGYSPRGLQLRVSYFEGAKLLPVASIRAPGLDARGSSRPVLS